MLRKQTTFFRRNSVIWKFRAKDTNMHPKNWGGLRRKCVINRFWSSIVQRITFSLKLGSTKKTWRIIHSTTSSRNHVIWGCYAKEWNTDLQTFHKRRLEKKMVLVMDRHSKLDCAKKFFLVDVHLRNLENQNTIPPPTRNLTSLSGYATSFEM